MSLKVRQIVSCLFVMLGGDGKLSKLTLKQKRFADEYIIS
ncbi:terminase small subunit, partial [Streptococcus pyogenes]